MLKPLLDKTPLLFSTKGGVFAMFLVIYFAKAMHVLCSVLLVKKYDNVQCNHANTPGGVEGNTLRNVRTTQRALNAHKNSWEAFISLSVAVLLALQQGKDSPELQRIVNLFVFVRVAYIFVYIIAYNEALSLIRSAVFAVGMILLVQIFTIGAGDLKLFG